MSETETTTTSAAPEVSSPADTSTPAPAETQAALSSTSTDPAAPAPYTPDYKFRYRDEHENKVDGEIDEWARNLINQENEEKFKQVWAKAHGLDFVKNRFNKTREEYKSYRTQVDPLLQGWNDLTALYNKGDLDSFFKGLQIPEQKIYQYVLDKLNYNELPPEQRAMRDQQQQVLRQNMELEKQNQFFQQQYEQQMVQSREHALSQTMSKPEVSAVAQAFDARVGREGAFRDEVVKRGILHWNLHQKDISPDEAVQEVMSLMGGMQQTMQQTLPAGASQVMPAQPKTPPTIPNVGAKNSSPAKRAPKSLDEIRKLAESL